MAWQIRSTSKISLGNGTRGVGFVFGQIETHEAYVQAIEAASNADLETVKSLVSVPEGVEIEEVCNALRTQLFGGPIQVDDLEAPQKDEQQTFTRDPATVTIDELGLSPGLSKALLERGLLNAEMVIQYAEANDGLTSIEGIGEKADEKIKAAMKKALGVS